MSWEICLHWLVLGAWAASCRACSTLRGWLLQTRLAAKREQLVQNCMPAVRQVLDG